MSLVQPTLLCRGFGVLSEQPVMDGNEVNRALFPLQEMP